MFFKRKKAPEHLTVDVAGTSFRQDALEKCPRDEKITAKLKPEPTNKHDRNAVKVMIGKNFIGYVPRTHSSIVSGWIREDRIESCVCEIWMDEDDRLLVASIKIQTKGDPQ